MARLIDADVLLTYVRQIDFLKTPNSTKLCACEIMKIINNQPTAYDVDAVVEEIKNDRKHFEDATFGYGMGATDAFDVSIMVIRKGGVNE